MAAPDMTHSCHVMCVTDEMFAALIFMLIWFTEIVFFANFTIVIF